MKDVNVGICGLGTVGGGTFNVLTRNAAIIAGRAGCNIRITRVASRHSRDDLELGSVPFSTDIFDVVNDPDIDIVVELIGGYDAAKELVLAAIAQGKHVVTANKALIAVHGNEIFEAAEKAGVVVAYEAGVAGGIPVIKAVREGLAANRIDTIAGIINGTGNYILTEMRAGREFGEVLKEAQALGYAEADPTFDVEGIDAAHKLTILAASGFGVPLQFEKAYTEGISGITPYDISHAELLGYRVKHLGIARRRDDGIELRVHPTLVPQSHLIAQVDGVLNAVLVDGDAVGQTMYYGPGAGDEATASAVIADIVDVARAVASNSQQRVPYLGFSPEALEDLSVLPMEDVQSAYYLRIQAFDHPGVLAKIAAILSEHGINIESIMQKESEFKDGRIPVIILTHTVQERQMNLAIEEMEALADIDGKVVRIRAENFN
ncbi:MULTISPECIES: homoserine dehydrogenase [Marinobacter]|uniref:Homoserine dehydrogenase n=1 Tax=Marinobacter excellens LAMA 842 TaxID=1306954 RepID=A0A137SB40_9GAMM|nr:MULTISPECIES: homoserine dehydrogenase [Marinobacter]MDX5441611.1 homoserine dehydrogenase [Alteromonadaceae bacterium]WBU42231.1 homoserine dehydrogenase [Marinobacter alkaliphilus]KXO09662.1 Homoserine dehydrogenase [Marinobacter excellens LAMA 842]MDX5336137.1 homoserine dehydrogenase [Marinobacter sp.]MDX5387177.1 homoserine dehydrogenase [Marinobacter sp.]